MGILMQEVGRLRTSRMGRNATWMMAGQGVSVVLQAVYFAILSRLLGAAEYGVFAGAFAFTSLAAQYSTLGSGTILLRYVSGNRDAFAAYWGNIVFLTLAVGGLLVVVLTLLGHFILNPASASLVVFAAVSNCLCFQFSAEMSRVFQTFERMRITAIVNMSTNLLRTLSAGAMLLIMHRASARDWAIASTLVSFLAAAVAVACITSFVGSPQIFPLMFPKHAWEGVGYAFAGSTSSAYNDLDKTMLSHYGLNHDNGIYTLAYRVIDVATIPIYSIREAALPKLFERGRTSIQATSELSYRLMRRSVPIGAALSVCTFLVAPLLPRIAGPSFSESANALRWLALIPLFRSVHHIAGSALSGAGMQQYRTISQVIAALFNFGLNLYMIPTYGWLGAAWSSLATDCLLSVSNLALLQLCLRRSVARS